MHVRKPPEARERTTGMEQLKQPSEHTRHWESLMSPRAEWRNLEINRKSGKIRICSDRKEVSACLGMEVGEEKKMDYKGHEEMGAGVVSIFTIHIHMLKPNKLHILNVCNLCRLYLYQTVREKLF